MGVCVSLCLRSRRQSSHDDMRSLEIDKEAQGRKKHARIGVVYVRIEGGARLRANQSLVYVNAWERQAYSAPGGSVLGRWLTQREGSRDTWSSGVVRVEIGIDAFNVHFLHF